MVDLQLSEGELAERRAAVTGFVEDVVADAGAEGAVIGLSGGIDSTTVAHVAVEALGPGAVKGLVLPAEVSREDNMSDAERVADELGIDYEVIGVEPLVEAFLEAYPDAEGHREAVGNLQARTRGVLNYLVANSENRVVLGTGNRSEALTGYYTKYGDQAVDCNPIGNLYKCQVRQLARDLGVPEDVVTKPSTAGLWEGQTDEGELGVDYDTLDRILALHIDGPLSASATAEELDVDRETVGHVRELYEQSAHKRAMPPAPEF